MNPNRMKDGNTYYEYVPGDNPRYYAMKKLENGYVLMATGLTLEEVDRKLVEAEKRHKENK